MPRGGQEDQKVYVGNLPGDVREKEVEDIFHKYGRIKYIDIKSGRGPAFAFVEFEDHRDAEDAVRARDGYEFDGRRIRVEFTRGVGPRGPGGRPLNEDGGGYRGGGGDRGDFRGGRGGGRGGGGGGGPQRRTGYRVIVEGLPPTGSWQDLKDHMREAGDVCYADVARDGTGVVEFTRYDDVKYAVRKLDDTKFRSHEGETAYIRVREDNSSGGGSGGGGGGGRDRSRSRSPRAERRASPKYSPRRSRSRTRSRSRSRSASRSPSRSPSPQ